MYHRIVNRKIRRRKLQCHILFQNFFGDTEKITNNPSQVIQSLGRDLNPRDL
jgi:hypothetical protein